MKESETERKIRALKNIRNLKGVPNEILDLENKKVIESEKEVMDNLNAERFLDESAKPIIEEEKNFNDVIRDLGLRINELDENEPDFEKKLKKLEARRNALISINRP